MKVVICLCYKKIWPEFLFFFNFMIDMKQALCKRLAAMMLSLVKNLKITIPARSAFISS